MHHAKISLVIFGSFFLLIITSFLVQKKNVNKSLQNVQTLYQKYPQILSQQNYEQVAFNMRVRYTKTELLNTN